MKSMILHSLLVGALLLLMIVPTNAQDQGVAFGGVISNDHVNKGDKLQFSASLMNNDTIPYYIWTLNVTFFEKLGNDAIRDPHTYNLSKTYDNFRGKVNSETTFTDTLLTKIEADPGTYLVSIFFIYLNDTNRALLPYTAYSLANQTVQVVGQTPAVKFARIVGIAIVVAFAVLVLFAIYNRFLK